MIIGNSKVAVGPMSMGTWAIGGGQQWGESDDELSMATVKEAIKQGVTWIDTAPAYGFGRSEEVVGKAIKDIREKVFLANKCGLQWYSESGQLHLKKDGRSVYRDLSAAGLRRDLEYSLKRMDTEYFDLYLTHWQSDKEPLVSIEETMTTLMDMKEEGKIHAIGICNVTEDQIRDYCKYGKVDVVQQKYSMLTRDAEALLPVCEEFGIILQTFSPLEQGLLTDQANRDIQIVPGNTRYTNVWWKEENRGNVINMLEGWKDLCEKYNCVMSNLAIAWTIKHNARFNVLCGARKPFQIAENAGALHVTLDDADYKRMSTDIDAVIAKRSGTSTVV